MDKKFKNNACLKTPANCGVISQVYQNTMALFKHYAQVGFRIEVGTRLLAEQIESVSSI